MKEIDPGKVLTNQNKGRVHNAVNTLGANPHGIQQRYLNEFDNVKNGPFHQQNWAKANHRLKKDVSVSVFVMPGGRLPETENKRICQISGPKSGRGRLRNLRSGRSREVLK